MVMPYDEIEKLVKLIDSTEDEATKNILRKLLATEVEIRGRFTTPQTQPIWKMPSTCGQCGISLEGSMCYSCPDPHCPTGMGPTVC